MEIFIAGIAGLLSHQLIFMHGEWHLHATKLLECYLSLYGIVTVMEARLRHLSWQGSFMRGLSVCGTYAICLWGSIIVYRLFFHPLRDFPGPIFARLSKLWHLAQCYDSKNHILIEKLYAQYGSFVRTGTNGPNNYEL